MKFVYSLQSVLEYRQQIEDIKKEKFAQILSILKVEKSKLDDITEEVKIVMDQTVSQNGFTLNDHKNYLYYMMNLQNKIQNQKIKIYEFEKKRETARAELEEAQKSRKIMESLSEKEFEKVLNEIKRKEAIELNDIAVIAYARHLKEEKQQMLVE